MSDAWNVIRAALRDTWSDLLTTAVVNLLWLGLTLLVVTAPPAALALFYVGHRLAHGDPTDPRDFLLAFHRYFWVSWRWGVLQVAMLLLLIGDVILSGQIGSGSAAGRLVQGLYLAGLAFWFLLQIYTLAFLFEQETLSLWTALRNGVLMLGSNPLFSATLGTLLLLLLATGTLLFFITSAAGGVLVALAGSHAVLNRLQAQRAGQQEKS
jgi:hypothetical protein